MLKVLIGLTIVCALFVSEGVVAQENDENLPLQYLKMHTLRELIVKMGEEPNTVVVSSSTSSKIGLVTTKPVSNEIRAEFRKTIQQKVDSLPAWLMNLDANQFTLALRGAQALLDRIESGKTIEDISCGMAVRIRLMEGVSSRIVVLGETLPKTGRFLTMDMKGKERASAIIQSLQKSFPEFKEKLAEIKLPITYGDIYAIQRLGKDPNGWPDIRPIGAVCYLRDP